MRGSFSIEADDDRGYVIPRKGRSIVERDRRSGACHPTPSFTIRHSEFRIFYLIFAARIMATRRYIVHGRVQGVGFRYFTKGIAEAFDITGTVRNTHDGDVEIVASGSVENLRSFKEQIEIGPAGARVDRVIAEDSHEERFDRFTVIR
jgi:acylphosphatase